MADEFMFRLDFSSRPKNPILAKFPIVDQTPSPTTSATTNTPQTPTIPTIPTTTSSPPTTRTIPTTPDNPTTSSIPKKTPPQANVTTTKRKKKVLKRPNGGGLLQENILITTPNSTRERLAAVASQKKAAHQRKANVRLPKALPPSSSTSANAQKTSASQKSASTTSSSIHRLSSPLSQTPVVSTSVTTITPPKLVLSKGLKSTTSRSTHSKSTSSVITKSVKRKTILRTNPAIHKEHVLPSPPAQLAPSLLLAALPWEPKDSNDKPPYSYATLIAQAILSSAEGKLTLSQIYTWISDKYKYYKIGDHGWQNSIRHNLSLNKAFVKLERRPAPGSSSAGKGCHWSVEPGSETQFLENLARRCHPSSNNSSKSKNKNKNNNDTTNNSNSNVPGDLSFDHIKNTSKITHKKTPPNQLKRKHPAARGGGGGEKLGDGGGRTASWGRVQYTPPPLQPKDSDDGNETDENTVDMAPPRKRVMTELSASDMQRRVSLFAGARLGDGESVMQRAIEAQNRRKKELARAQGGLDHDESESSDEDESDENESESDSTLSSDKENMSPLGSIFSSPVTKETALLTAKTKATDANTSADTTIKTTSPSVEVMVTPVRSRTGQVQELVRMRQEPHEKQRLLPRGYHAQDEKWDEGEAEAEVETEDEVKTEEFVEERYEEGMDSLLPGLGAKQSPWREVLKSDLFEEDDEERRVAEAEGEEEGEAAEVAAREEAKDQDQEQLPPSSPIEILTSQLILPQLTLSSSDLMEEMVLLKRRGVHSSKRRQGASLRDIEGVWKVDASENENNGSGNETFVTDSLLQASPLTSKLDLDRPRHSRVEKREKRSTAIRKQTLKTTSSSSHEIHLSPPGIRHQLLSYDPFMSSTGQHNQSPNTNALAAAPSASSPLQHGVLSSSPSALQFGFEDSTGSFDHLCSYDYLQQARSSLDTELAWGTEFPGLEFGVGRLNESLDGEDD